MDNIDKNKFTTLETQVQNIYKSVKLSAASDEAWINKSACDANTTGGDWPDGTYNCESYIVMKKDISSLKEVNELQDRYYPIFNNSPELKTETELSLYLPNDFGKKFVVSSAEKKFKEVKSNIACTYILKIAQKYENKEFTSDTYSTEIIDNRAVAYLTFRCEETARGSWYKEVHGIDVFRD